ncbi:hypothetical protein C7R92_27500 [Brevibacillus porteri]|uniref:Uncharacterized protein n=1 Tax=Brevibacillus porteri TaxID=2126350 RepID=A0ABX5FIM1_9BACL|nr:hypothetical protein C7R92_27500 [Brevibacillus porteri]
MARTMKENCGHPELEHKKLIMHTLFSEIVINSYGEAVDRPGRRVACEIKSFKTKKRRIIAASFPKSLPSKPLLFPGISIHILM